MIEDENKKNNDFIESIQDNSSGVTLNKPAKTIAEEKREAMKKEIIAEYGEEPVKNQNKPIENKPSIEDFEKQIEEFKPTEEEDDSPSYDDFIKNKNTENVVIVRTENDNNDNNIKEKETEKEEITTIKTEENEPKIDSQSDIKDKKKEKVVSVISPAVAESIKNKEFKPKIANSIDVVDNLDEKIIKDNYEIAKENMNSGSLINNDNVVQKVNDVIENEYVDTDNHDETIDENDINVTIIKEPSKLEEKKKEEVKEAVEKATKEPTKSSIYYGGDGNTCAFKLRTAKISKILRNVNIEDSSTIEAIDISKKKPEEKQNIYLSTVLPSMQPNYSVVPLIASGVVITMTAFMWRDIEAIMEIEEQLDDLDPKDEDYIYEKNKNFLEKRRKQLQLFYNHIYSVSGFEEKPDIDTFYRKIVKFIDIPQLFFAAYAATFQKKYAIPFVCNICGTEQVREVSAKDLCFLLNKNIKLEQLNRYLEKGAAISTKEAALIYEEFQKEKIVEMCNATYRTTKKLPISSFYYDLSIPSVYDAYDTLDEISDIFRNKPFEVIDDDQNVVSIDSSFGLTTDLLKMRSYLYLKSLLVPQVVSEDKESNSVQVSFIEFTDKNSIINSIYNLSSEDYKTLMGDKMLRDLMKVTGIRHAFNSGICESEICKSNMGNIPIDPESLFFTIARQDSNAIR